MGNRPFVDFEKTVAQLRASPSEANAHRASNAARIAMARFYGVLLLAGGIRLERVDAFGGTLAECDRALSKVKPRERVADYIRRILWYRGLVDRFRRLGLVAINDAIEGAFDAMQRGLAGGPSLRGS